MGELFDFILDHFRLTCARLQPRTFLDHPPLSPKTLLYYILHVLVSLLDKMVQTSTIVAATVGTIATGLVGISPQKLKYPDALANAKLC
jgi:hypothetical protein